jgi:SAM-dependent methyltransferase
VRSFFDAIARRYDRDFALSGAVSRERLARVLGEIAGKRRVLVLGLGTGRELPALFDAGHEPTGIELSPEMIALCNKRARTCPIVEGDFYAPLPFPDGSFDAALALHGTLAHPPDASAHSRLAKELARVLGSDGVFVAEVPSAAGLSNLGVRITGPTSFVHRDESSGIEIEGVALSVDEWAAAFEQLVVRVETLGELEYLIVGINPRKTNAPPSPLGADRAP